MDTFAEWVAGGRRIPVGGHELFVRQDGPAEGRPVTLIHGFPTSSHDWAPIVPGLTAAGCRVTTLDLLGFGASDKPRRHTYNIHEQASLVEGVWERGGVGETALVAHDYGVSVAQELVARDAHRLTRTAWLNGGVYPDLHRPIGMQRLMHGPLGGLLGRLTNERRFTAAMREVLGRPLPDAALHEMWLAVSRNGGAALAHRLLRYIDDRAAHAERWTGALESYPGPMLCIWGPADPVSGAHVVPRLRQRLPSARICVLSSPPEVGHYPQCEDPAAVLGELAPFLAASAG